MEITKQHLRIERKHLRLKAVIHCLIGLPNGDLSDAQICDLSIGGLKFSCGRHTISNILPENIRAPIPLTGTALEIHFELQQPDQAALPVKCETRVVHFERLAQDVFHVGLQFTSMEKTVKKALRAYLESATMNQDE
jgi:c-di-GMP-binding flagellar brake protein YcgR